jgi:hypothetical protein
MIEVVLAIIGFSGAMGIPAFLTAIVKSAPHPKCGPRPCERTRWDAAAEGGQRCALHMCFRARAIARAFVHPTDQLERKPLLGSIIHTV